MKRAQQLDIEDDPKRAARVARAKKASNARWHPEPGADGYGFDKVDRAILPAPRPPDSFAPEALRAAVASVGEGGAPPPDDVVPASPPQPPESVPSVSAQRPPRVEVIEELDSVPPAVEPQPNREAMEADINAERAANPPPEPAGPKIEAQSVELVTDAADAVLALIPPDRRAMSGSERKAWKAVIEMTFARMQVAKLPLLLAWAFVVIGSVVPRVLSWLKWMRDRKEAAAAADAAAEQKRQADNQAAAGIAQERHQRNGTTDAHAAGEDWTRAYNGNRAVAGDEGPGVRV